MTDPTGPLLLASSDESFKTLFHLSPVGMAISSMSDGSYLEVNGPYCAIVGYPRDQIVGRTSIEFKPIGENDRLVLLENTRLVGSIRNLDIKPCRRTDTAGRRRRPTGASPRTG